MKLEYVETIKLAHPYLKGFDQISHCLTAPERELVARGDISAAVTARTEADLTPDAVGTVWTTTFFIGLVIDRKPGAPPLPSRCVLELAHAPTSRLFGQSTTPSRYFLPHQRIHQARQDVGQVRPKHDGRHGPVHESVRPRAARKLPPPSPRSSLLIPCCLPSSPFLVAVFLSTCTKAGKHPSNPSKPEERNGQKGARCAPRSSWLSRPYPRCVTPWPSVEAC